MYTRSVLWRSSLGRTHCVLQARARGGALHYGGAWRLRSRNGRGAWGPLKKATVAGGAGTAPSRLGRLCRRAWAAPVAWGAVAGTPRRRRASFSLKITQAFFEPKPRKPFVPSLTTTTSTWCAEYFRAFFNGVLYRFSFSLCFSHLVSLVFRLIDPATS